ncbi:putative nuclease HARBI1 [Armigeres subalbatus]|uniref:putative nuclease HARBI1 n=1 Tax=Armigeres subalbatus TaxID=124917 RepID=UPI002ED255FF
MSVELWFETDSEDEEDYANLAAERRRIRDNSNPLDQTEKSFIRLFRVSKDIFVYLLEIITAKINPVQLSTSVSPTVMLAASLRFFAEGNYQKGVGNDRYIGLAQPTMSKVLQIVLDIIENEVCPTVIQFPSEDRETNAIKLAFYQKTGFPGVIGCIDGTHISIIPPARDKHLYYNRKGFHSLNVLLVCDNNLMIRYLDANHPGSSHDSFVWNGSSLNQLLFQKYNNGERSSWLLGDAGYPLKPFLITPFLTGANKIERHTRFNDIHSKTRITVERSIGVAKNTFRCLLGARQLYYTPEKTTKIINVCVALHNLRIQHKMDYDEPELADEGEDLDLRDVNGNQNEGVRIREQILNNIL